jgi:hypothetical protein
VSRWSRTPVLLAILAATPPPSVAAAALPEGSCQSLLASDPELLGTITARIEERLATALRDASLAGAGQQGYLDDVARAAAADLTALLSELPALRYLRHQPVLSGARLDGLLADLFLVAGRRQLAAEAYRRAAGVATLCGASYDGKLYTVELWRHRQGRPRLSHDVLVREPGTWRVLERRLLPGLPDGFRTVDGTLEIVYKFASAVPWIPDERRTLRLAAGRWSYPVWVPAGSDPLARLRSLDAAWALAENFVYDDDGGRASDFRPRKNVREGLAAELPELETALLAAIAEDPTQPWYLFLLGQCRWAQGRRPQAAAVWEALLAGELGAIPYYEWAWMAQSFELYGQPEWADAAYRRALERRRRLPRPVGWSSDLERQVNAPFTKSWAGAARPPALDPDRAYLWWLRAREISGVADADGFRAVLWADYLERRGDDTRAAAELAYLARARRGPPEQLSAAYVDYGLWLVYAALAGLLFVPLAFLAKSVRPAISWLVALTLAPLVVLLRLPRGGWRRIFSALRRSTIILLPLLVCGLAYLAFTFLAVLVAHFRSPPSHPSDTFYVTQRQLWSAGHAPPEQRLEAALATHAISDTASARKLYKSLPETPRQESRLAALDRDLPPWISEPADRLPRFDLAALTEVWGDHELWHPRNVPGILKFLVGNRLPAILGEAAAQTEIFHLDPIRLGIAALAGLALVTLLWIRGWLGRGCLLLVPGSFAFLAGRPLRAYLTFLFFAFAAGPSLWLLAGMSAGQPSPGWLASQAPLPQADEIALPPGPVDELIADNFWSLLWVYPGARPFYLLVALSLAASLYLHVRDAAR